MRLEVHRVKFYSESTLGSLFVNGQLFCSTLEDRVRAGGVKVQDETAIPAGTYNVIVNMSQRFGKLMPRLEDVPMFTGILIHSGNDHTNTHGCILVGSEIDGPDHIHGGSVTFPVLLTEIKNALDAGEKVSITITNDAPIYNGD